MPRFLHPTASAAAALFALLASGASVLADNQVLPSQRWQAPMDGTGLARTQSGRLLGHLVVDVGLWGGYERNPLILTDRRDESPLPLWSDSRNPLRGYSPFRRRVASLLTDRVASEASVSIGLLNWVQLYAAMPVTLWQQRGEGVAQATTPLGPVNEFNLGDLRLGGKLRLLTADQALVDVALLPQLVLPIGVGFHALSFNGVTPQFSPGTAGWAQGYTSEGFPSLITELAVSRELWGLFVGANAGLRLRRPYELLKLTISHEAVVRGGVGFKGRSLAKHVSLMRFFPVEAGLEFQASNALVHPYLAVPYATPGASTKDVALVTPRPTDLLQPSMEVDGFVGVDAFGIHPYVGGGVGVLSTWGTPEWRLMGGIRVVPSEFVDGIRGKSTNDRDRDGVLDPADACPNVAGEAATRGCPDGDHDGVADAADRCPWEPRGTVDDADGCPHTSRALAAGEPEPVVSGEPDSDGDGVSDSRDPCPRRAEDKDGFADEDGCPDQDNDEDDVADATDACPLEAEVVNGIDDADGCPDQDPNPDVGDPDHDGVASEDDRCPLEPGSPDDGCPHVAVAERRGAAAPAPKPAEASPVAAQSPLPPPPPPPAGKGKANAVVAAALVPGTAMAPEGSDVDGDGVQDREDACPQRPEDADGFEDEDGCPDADNDADGVADASDDCALSAEDLDGDHDDDGCPEAAPVAVVPGDGDADGVNDVADVCPWEPEDANGIRDDDGCPEGVPVPHVRVAREEPAEAPPVVAELVDLDGDGIADSEDACRARPEDLDGFADEDGCPDRDNDDDGVADAADRCPLEAESENGWRDDDGCPDADPDADEDTVADAADRCPFEPEDLNGLRDEDGCPDAPTLDELGDLVTIQTEAAPADAALATAVAGHSLAQTARVSQEVMPWSAGDADKDGNPNATDACPRRAEDKDGFEDEDGCPETDEDGDGIQDAADRCPLEGEVFNGNKDADGCPDPDGDQDGDGLLDGADRCPLEAEDRNGVRDDDGCPDEPLVMQAAKVATEAPRPAAKPRPAQKAQAGAMPWTAGDADKDGIPNAQDPCPRAAEDKDGVEDADGCPEADNDHDGVLDRADKCPLVAEVINGVKDEDGCPDVGASSVEMQATRVDIKEKVYFKYGTAALSTRSNGLLNQVSALLKAYPDARIRVEGHTDTSGPERRNERLGQQRAESVVKYLLKRGIPRNRLRAVGYGPSRPLASNDTVEGREANRRVEFVLEE